MAQAKRPAFRKPWTHGALAYIEADNFTALKEGLKGTRTEKMVHMPNSGPAGNRKCASCGVKLKDPYELNPGSGDMRTDQNSTWHYSNKTKTGYGMHYGCSWGALFTRILAIKL